MENYSIDTIQIILGLIVWILIFVIIRRTINKTEVSEKRIGSVNSQFYDKLFEELQIFYHIEKTNNVLILRSNKMEDIVAKGVLKIQIHNKDAPSYIKITYERKIKLSGYLIVLLGIAMCYIGVLIPVIIIQNTKKSVYSEIDRIFSISKSIL